jgi:hypothetical protein
MARETINLSALRRADRAMKVYLIAATTQSRLPERCSTLSVTRLEVRTLGERLGAEA